MLNDNQISVGVETLREYVRNTPYIDDEGIWVPCHSCTPKGTASAYKMLISKDLFIEAYNKWIKGENNE